MRAWGWQSLSVAILAAACACAGVGACGDDRRDAPSTHDAPAAAAADAIPVAPLPVRPLGFASPDDFFYLYRAGSDDFLAGREAEQTGDYPTAEARYRRAIARDEHNLDAHWSLGVTLARRGAFAEAVPPLSIALAADWVRFGERMLASTTLAPFRESREGVAFVQWAAQQRSDFERALLSAVVVVGRGAPPVRRGDKGKVVVGHRAEVFAHDLAAGRWLRLTYTDGAIVGVVRAPGSPLAAYVRYRQLWSPGRAQSGSPDKSYFREIRVGAVDVATGQIQQEVKLADVVSLRVGWMPEGTGHTLVAEARMRGKNGGVEKKPLLLAIDPVLGTATPLAKARRRLSELVVDAGGEFGHVSAVRTSVDGVAADWDARGGAGAFRLTASRRTVTLPDGELADVASMTWSTSGTHLAFATLPTAPCGAPDASPRRLYIVDAATGRLRTIADVADDPAPAWLDDARLAWVARDGVAHAVRVIDAASGGELARIAPAAGVGTTRLLDLAPCSDAPAAADPGAGAGGVGAGSPVDENGGDDDPLFDLSNPPGTTPVPAPAAGTGTK